MAVLLSVLRTALAGEHRFAALAGYCDTVQRHGVRPEQRTRTLYWLYELAYDFKFELDTVACAVNLFDRVLSKRALHESKSQLVALVCLVLASKLHEGQPLCADDLTSCFASTKDIFKTELDILAILDWNVNSFTPVSFIRTALQLVPDDSLRARLCSEAEKYAILAMYEYSLVGLPVAAVGIACIQAACGAAYHVSPLVTLLASNGISVKLDANVLAVLQRAYDVAYRKSPVGPVLSPTASAGGSSSSRSCDDSTVTGDSTCSPYAGSTRNSTPAFTPTPTAATLSTGAYAGPAAYGPPPRLNGSAAAAALAAAAVSEGEEEEEEDDAEDAVDSAMLTPCAQTVAAPAARSAACSPSSMCMMDSVRAEAEAEAEPQPRGRGSDWRAGTTSRVRHESCCSLSDVDDLSRGSSQDLVRPGTSGSALSDTATTLSVEDGVTVGVTVSESSGVSGAVGVSLLAGAGYRGATSPSAIMTDDTVEVPQYRYGGAVLC